MDEIDIEEHDVLDDPNIRRIFPDLSVIKKEISKYYDEGPETKPEPVSNPLIPQTELTPQSPHDTKDFLTLSDYPNSPGNSGKYLQNNVIILGSKPNKLCTKKLNLETIVKCVPKVILQNINVYLKKSKTYCKGCMILFPRTSDLEVHNKYIHDQRNKTLTINKRKGIGKSISIKKYQCNICISVLSSRGNLIRHLKNIHRISHKSNTKEKDGKSDDEATGESLDSDKSSNIAITGANCFHCHKIFPTQKALVDHLYDILEPKKIDCKICAMKFSNQENLEKHTIAIHNDNYAASNSFECHKCAIRFLSKVKLDQHNQDKHKTIRAKHEEADNTIDNPVMSYDSAESANEELPEEQDEHVKLPKKRKNEVTIDELTEEEDAPLALIKRKRRSPNKQSESLAESADYQLKQKNKIKISNINLKKTSGAKLSINKTSHNVYDKKILVENAYQCSVCFHYIFSFRNYSRHMARNHKMENVPKVKKVLFDSQCKFCLSKLVNINSYNNHISKSHQEKTKLYGRKLKMGISHAMIKPLSKNGENKSYAFKSLLYKCNKCDIYFMTAKTAMNHSEHMEVLINWKCCICNRIFKKIDKFLHVKQHSNSHSFTVYNICDTDINLVLYLCLKCTIHFSEDSFVDHYSTCGIQTPDSVYCRICDSLISKMDFDSHDQIHVKNKHINASDFTIVETDLIKYNDYRSSLIESKKNDILCSEKIIYDKSRVCLGFCKHCQCMMSFLSNLKTTRKLHLEARCMHVKKLTCKECGIVITSQTFKTHRKLHQDVKDLNIQNLFFFDLKSKKPISPPIPVYPNCNICRVHFLSKNDVIEHECNGYEYLTCHVCQIKLSEIAYKFHMQFHEYSMENSKELQSIPQFTSKVNHTSKANNTLNVSTTVSSLNRKDFESQFLYGCKICKITFDAYDPVIKHCQGHYDRRKAPVAKKSCQYCALNFEETYHKVHEKMHSREKYDVQSMKMLNFDPLYFCLDNKFWIKHIFNTVSDYDIETIISNSIYRFECRLKMEVFQAGPSNSTLFECEKCLVFVDPGSLYEHAQNTECTKLRKHPCITCGLCFNTAKYKMDHEKLHKYRDISLKSYKVVRTNKKKDQIFHNMMFKSRNKFVIYQCRNCLVSVDKTQRNVHCCVFKNIVKCSHCELLFCKQDYYTHRNRHKELEQFNTNNISVVCFGKKLNKGNPKILPSFRGKNYDYTFYKCTTCGLCLRTEDSTFEHKCIFDDSKCKCPKCNLYFLREELSIHALLHETDPEFEDNNLKIIIFDGQPNLKDLKRIVGNKENSSLQDADSVINQKNVNESLNNNIITELENPVKLLKCDCGLHFIDKANARKHYNNCNPNMKISKQHCSKCELLFTPGELFTHLLTHHGDKKHEYKFDISLICQDDKKTPLFKCIKCNLHFVKESEVNSHFDECDEHGIGGEKCKKCGLRFKLSSLYKNKHRTVCEKKYEIVVISEIKVNGPPSEERIDETSGLIDNIITKKDMVLLAKDYSLTKDYLLKIDLSKYNNVLYKCDVCDVYYITENTWKRHVHFLAAYDACKICGLNFSLQTLMRHNYIHHEKFNLKKEEFIIKSNDL